MNNLQEQCRQKKVECLEEQHHQKKVECLEEQCRQKKVECLEEQHHQKKVDCLEEQCRQKKVECLEEHHHQKKVDCLEEQCRQKVDCLDEMILQANHFLNQAPEGTLRVTHQRKCARYYWKNSSSNAQGIYIGRKEIALAHELAQKDYLQRFVEEAMKTKNQLTEFMKTYNWSELERLHERLSKARQDLIEPFFVADNEYAIRWYRSRLDTIEQLYRTGRCRPYPLDEEAALLTERGERVRSKSEKILADKLYKMNIPYVYEMPLLLKNNRYVYPDFTVLNVRTREEFYWEHFGMMGDSDYCEKVIRKIKSYGQNNIQQGKKLIATYETLAQPLNMDQIESVIEAFLL